MPSTLLQLQLMWVHALLHTCYIPCPQPEKGISRKSHVDQKTKTTSYHFIIFGKKLLWCHGIWWEWMPFWHCLQHFLIYIIWQRKYSGFIWRHLWTDKAILITGTSPLWKKCIQSSITSCPHTHTIKGIYTKWNLICISEFLLLCLFKRSKCSDVYFT